MEFFRLVLPRNAAEKPPFRLRSEFRLCLSFVLRSIFVAKMHHKTALSSLNQFNKDSIMIQ